MVIDFQSVSMAGDIIVFPDFSYAALPEQPADIRPTIALEGVGGGNTIRTTGTAK